MGSKLSIIIPSRSDQFLQKTIDSLLENAEEEVEIIVCFDGIWSDIKDDPRVIVFHHGEIHDNVGMRGSINAGMLLSSGEYVMKIDEQCTVDKGVDTQLQAHL